MHPDLEKALFLAREKADKDRVVYYVKYFGSDEDHPGTIFVTKSKKAFEEETRIFASTEGE